MMNRKERSESMLKGMEEIRAYVSRTESTVIDWILKRGFPASKMGGGIWESDKKSIDEWRRKQLELEGDGVALPDAKKSQETPLSKPVVKKKKRVVKRKKKR